MNNTPENRIKCRFCSETFPKTMTTKGGHKIEGYDLLQSHCIAAHMDEPAVREFLLREDES